MEKLGINLNSLIFQIINFLILFTLLAKFVFPLIMKILNERREQIDESIKNTQKIKHELESIEEKKKNELNKVRQEALDIIKQAKTDAENVRKDLVAKADKEAGQILAAAQEDIKIKEKNALRHITSQAIELSLIAAENILKEKINNVNQDEIIQRSLKEFDKAYEQA